MNDNTRSGGPRTPEGKARTRLNAVRHGLRSKSVLLPGEDPEEFYELKSKLRAEWKPQTQSEEFLVEQLLSSEWRLRRIALMEQDLFIESFECCNQPVSDASSSSDESPMQPFDANLPGALTPALHKLGLLTRYENSIRRAYYKALSELRSLQSERQKQEQAAQKAAHDTHVRQVVAQVERDNEAFNQQLIAICEQIPSVPNDGYKYIQPRPVSSFGKAPKDNEEAA